MQTFIFHLPTNSYEEALELLEDLESIQDRPVKLRDLEVGSGETEGEIVCGFSIDVEKDEEADDVAYWLIGSGFGIPKIYKFRKNGR